VVNSQPSYNHLFGIANINSRYDSCLCDFKYVFFLHTVVHLGLTNLIHLTPLSKLQGGDEKEELDGKEDDVVPRATTLASQEELHGFYLVRRPFLTAAFDAWLPADAVPEELRQQYLATGSDTTAGWRT
jgi:hypothetical protein